MKAWVAVVAVSLLLAAPLRAQTGEGAIETRVRGKVVDVKDDTIRLQSAKGNVQTYALAPAAAQRARSIKPGSDVLAILDVAGGPPRILEFLSVTPPGRTRGGPNGEGPTTTASGKTGVLLATDLACEVSVDYKKVATLPAGGHTTIELPPGESLISAVAASGAAWKQKVKVGSERLVVEIVLAGIVPPAAAADFDRAAAPVVAALLDLKADAGYVAYVLEKKAWGFHDVQLTVPLQRAQATLKRAQDRLAGLAAPDEERRRAQAEITRAAGEAAQGATLLTEAVTTAQQENSSLGKSAQTRGQGLAHLSMSTPEAAALAALVSSEPFRQALPTDRWAEAGLTPHALDVRLGAEYDGDSPPRLGAVAAGGLAATLGLRPGDRVMAIEGQPMATGWALKQALHTAAGKTVEIDVEHEGKRDKRRVAVPQ